MALKLLKDITYPDYPQMVEIRVVNKWYTRGNNQQYSYLFVDKSEHAIEAIAPSNDESHLDNIITLQQCYRVTNYTTIKARNYACVVPHSASLKISRYTHFQQINDDNIPRYYFNFVPFNALEGRERRGSPLSDYIGRAEAIRDLLSTKERRTGKTIYLRRVTIMDDSNRTVEVTLWEDKGRQVDKIAAIHQIVAVTATFTSKHNENTQLTSTNATMFFVDPPISNLPQLKQRFTDLPHLQHAPRQHVGPSTSIPKVFIRDLLTEKGPDFNRAQLLCQATITDISTYRPWYYLGCQRCPRSVNEEMTEHGDILWRCLTHDTMNEPTKLYILNAHITDDSGSIEVVFYNRAVEQLTGISCHTLIETKNYADPKVLPQEIKNIQGQHKLLQLTVKPDGNVTVNKIIEPETITEPTSKIQQPKTPTTKQEKRLLQHSSSDTTEPQAKQPKTLSETSSVTKTEGKKTAT